MIKSYITGFQQLSPTATIKIPLEVASLYIFESESGHLLARTIENENIVLTC